MNDASQQRAAAGRLRVAAHMEETIGSRRRPQARPLPTAEGVRGCETAPRPSHPPPKPPEMPGPRPPADPAVENRREAHASIVVSWNDDYCKSLEDPLAEAHTQPSRGSLGPAQPQLMSASSCALASPQTLPPGAPTDQRLGWSSRAQAPAAPASSRLISLTADDRRRSGGQRYERDLRSSLDAVKKITNNIVLGGDLIAKHLLGNPADTQDETDAIEVTRGLWGNRSRDGMDATDIVEAVEGFDLRHYPHSGRLQPTNHPYQRSGTPAILDYILSSAEAFRTSTVQVESAAAFATSHSPILLTAQQGAPHDRKVRQEWIRRRWPGLAERTPGQLTALLHGRWNISTPLSPERQGQAR